MKKVTIHLAALTRVFCDIELEVKDDITDDELDALVDKVYDETDGGEYQDDHDFWEQGDCSWSFD
jgi:hypothetical protein